MLQKILARIFHLNTEVRDMAQNAIALANSAIQDSVELFPNILSGEVNSLSTGGVDCFKVDGVYIHALPVRSTEESSYYLYAPKGSKISPHFHSQSETVVIVSGKVKEEVSGKIITSKELIEILPKQEHKWLFLENTVAIVYFKPPLLIV